MTADQIHALAEAEKAALSHTAMGMDIADAAAVGMKVRAHYEKRIAALREALEDVRFRSFNTTHEHDEARCRHVDCVARRAIARDDEAAK